MVFMLSQHIYINSVYQGNSTLIVIYVYRAAGKCYQTFLCSYIGSRVYMTSVFGHLSRNLNCLSKTETAGNYEQSTSLLECEREADSRKEIPPPPTHPPYVTVTT
jgi:hypothetical protein